MHRVLILVVTVLAFGCSARSVDPLRGNLPLETLARQQGLQSRWRTIAIPSNSNPIGLAADPNGYVWTANEGDDSITKVSTRGSYTNYNVSAEPVSVAEGSDGNVWLTVRNNFENGTILRVTPQGVETDCDVTSSDQNLSDIINGPDGALWFSQFGQNGPFGVWRIDTQGNSKFFEYDDGVFSLVAGPDGNIWFSGFQYVVKMSTRGQVITRYPAPERLVNGTVGSDGSLWFVGARESKLYRVTTDGQITTFPAPGGVEAIIQIAPVNGQLGLTGNVAGMGSLVPFDLKSLTFLPPVPGPSGLFVIVRGPDGNYWFTADTNSKIYSYFNNVAAVPPSSSARK